MLSKITEIFHTEWRRRSDLRRDTRTLVDVSFDPVLKAADECIGKLLYLAKDDFRSIRHVSISLTRLHNDDFNSLLFILVKFWATIDIFRHENLSMTIDNDSRRDHFQRFVRCLEIAKKPYR